MNSCMLLTHGTQTEAMSIMKMLLDLRIYMGVS